MENLEKFPMVEEVVYDLRCVDGLTTEQAVNIIFHEFQSLGSYDAAKLFGQLVNNSGEEFAIQWMSFYNQEVFSNFY